MSKTDKKLSEIFDLDPISSEVEVITHTEIVEIESVDVVETDTEFARKNIRSLIDKAMLR